MRDRLVRLCSAVASAALVACGEAPAPTSSEAVYLFDCLGRIQAVGPDGSAAPAVRVSDLDRSLPRRVMDGCAIHAGWHDTDASALVLEVQTMARADAEDGLPTKLVSLALPDLDLVDTSDSPTARAAARKDPAAALLPTVNIPFTHARAYVRADAGVALLEEVRNVDLPGEMVAAVPAAEGVYVLPHAWRIGRVTTRTFADGRATGRYALVGLESGARRGSILTLARQSDEHRVLCYSSEGLVLIAADRDTLLMLDVSDPTRIFTVSDLAVDLLWTACAAG